MSEGESEQHDPEQARENSQRAFELNKLALAAYERMSFFFLAAAGSAITFAIVQTIGNVPATWMIPALIAVVLWGLSFWFGCEHLISQRGAVMSNAHQLDQGGVTNLRPSDDWKSFNKRSNLLARRQYGAFNVGALFFVVAHIQRVLS